MRKHLTIILSVLALALTIAIPASAKKKAANDGEAKIHFSQNTYDFGIINEKNGPVTHEFEFDNAGDGNLVILKATAECGCTKPSYPDKPIAPGKKGKIKVTFNPAGRQGGFEKVVTVTTNGKPRKAHLKIRGTIR